MVDLRLSAQAALVLMLFFLGVVPSFAGAIKLGQDEVEKHRQQEEIERQARVVEVRKNVDRYYRAARETVPGLTEPLIDYLAEAVPPTCWGSQPKTFAILVGADDIGRFTLKGPANDLALLSDVLLQLGVAKERIKLVQAEDANRAGLAAAFEDVLSQADCEDQVIVHFSAISASVDEVFLALKPNGKDLGAEPMIPPKDIPSRIVQDSVEVEPEQRFFAELVFGSKQPDVVIFLNDESETFNEVIVGRDVSDYMLAIRNKGAHAIAILDINNAAAADIQGRHRIAGDQSVWSFDFGESEADTSKDRGPALVPGHGDFALFYASGVDGISRELKLPDGAPDAKVFGLFTYSVAEALMWRDNMSPRTIAERIGGSGLYENRRAMPVMEASQPDMVIVAEAMKSRSGKNPIRILNPAPKRGAMPIDKARVDIEGIVDWPAHVLAVHVDMLPAELDSQGRFKSVVNLKTGLNRIAITAMTSDSKLHSSNIELIYEGDRKALQGEGRRIAVIIANQSYASGTGLTSLSTPVADAEALSEVLKRKYGFVTSVRSADGTETSLMLRDPAKRDIELALHRVGKSVGKQDTVLIFYAGHGVFEPATSTAYWVPSDAEQGFEPSYLSAADISAAIQRMQAGNVILISDSCYSGALLRGEPSAAERIGDDKRMQALLTLQARRSRIVITSGNNEPVEDLGGDGHSVFARALLTGLETMEHDAFSSRELFDGYILQQVTANADQEPQYRPLEKVGHEGGDFVFVKQSSDPATAAQ